MKIFLLSALLVINGVVKVYPARLSGKIMDFCDYHLEKEENLDKIKSCGNFLGRKGEGSGGMIGWFEYDVIVDISGWYEVLIDYDPMVSNKGWTLQLTEYTVDGRRLNDYPYEVAFGRKKAGNIWMDKGPHKFRFENRNWFTQSPVTGYEFRPVGDKLAQNIRVGLDPADDHYGGSYYGVGESFPVHIYTGGNTQGVFTLEVVRESNRTIAQMHRLLIVPSAGEEKHTVRVSVKEEGNFFCRYKVDGREVSKSEALRYIQFSTIDTSPAEVGESVGEVSKTLLYTIDCATMEPHYQSTGSKVLTGKMGTYRETGERDWDYFAYRLPPLQTGGAYLVEVDLPDDKQRGIQIQFRERDPVKYIIGPGVETGEPFRNSGKFVTQRYVFWPRINGEQARIAIVNLGHSDHSAPAAVKAIRLYKADDPLPALKRLSGGREFISWFEEPLRWLDPYGARDNSRGEMIRSATNLARTMRYNGATTLFLAVDVYGEGMYPSKYRYSSRYTGDPLKMMLLVAQKYGLKVVADISPKQGTLTTKYYNEKAPERYQLFLHDKAGKHYNYATDHYTAMFNPVHPEVQREIKRKTAEIAGRYKDLPALAGVSIRVMGWEPHTMTSFLSLDWGYGPYTGKIFSAYLGIPDPGTPHERYALFTGKFKKQWVDWRISVVHKLLKEIRDTCRSVKPDFHLYSVIHSTKWAGRRLAHEAGLDNFDLEGFSYVNALYSLGRRSDWQTRRKSLTEPEKLGQFDASRAHLFGYQYFEDGKKSIPNSALGLKGSDSKWISAHPGPVSIYHLESYARAMAVTDAALLGTGGNTYFIDPAISREFLADYIVLPKSRFSTLSSGSSVVVRELKGEEYLFYLLNTSDQEQQAILEFSGSTPVTRLSTGAGMTPDSNKRISFHLQPFHLYSFSAKGNRITSVLAGEK